MVHSLYIRVLFLKKKLGLLAVQNSYALGRVVNSKFYSMICLHILEDEFKVLL